MKIILFFFLSVFSLGIVFGQTTLSSGDMALVGMDTPGEDFMFVTFVDLAAGTQIFFTDEEADNDFTIGTGEGTVLYTAPAGGILAGTVISYIGNSANFTTTSDGLMALGNSGDGIIAYQGTSVGNVSTFLHAIGEDAGDMGTFPGGFTNFVTYGADDGEYNGLRTGLTAAQYLTNINNSANWTTSGSGVLPFDLTFFNLPPAGCTISNVTSSLVSCANGIATIDVTFEFSTPDDANFEISGNNGFTTIASSAYTTSPQTVQVTATGNNVAQTFTITDNTTGTCTATSAANNFNCPVATQLDYTSVPATAINGTSFTLEVCATDGSATQTDYSTGITLTQTTGTAATFTPSSPATPTNGCVTFTVTPTADGEDIAFDVTSAALTTASSGNITVNAPSTCGNTGGLLINEFSNGSGGSKEYIELVVLGDPANPTAPVDLTGWIIDDNNGTHGTSGVAEGHIRLSNSYNAMTPGDIIVIYNNQDANTSLPADDLTDSNNDGVYIIPANDASIEAAVDNANCTNANTATPVAANLCDGNPSAPVSTYDGNIYATAQTDAWNKVGYRNGGDAAVVRCPGPDFGLFHAMTYGDNNAGGEPNAVHTGTGSGSGQVWLFTCNAMYNESAYTRTSVSGNESPGVSNNADNDDLLQGIINGTVNYSALKSSTGSFPCPTVLPVDLLSFSVKNLESIIEVSWLTVTEINNDYFNIERSEDGKEFYEIGKVKGAGNYSGLLEYKFQDLRPKSGLSYYRLKQIDFDGKFEYSEIKTVNRIDVELLNFNIYPNPVSDYLFISTNVEANEESSIEIFDVAGRLVLKQNFNNLKQNLTKLDISNLISGSYILRWNNLYEQKNLYFIKK